MLLGGVEMGLSIPMRLGPIGALHKALPCFWIPVGCCQRLGTYMFSQGSSGHGQKQNCRNFKVQQEGIEFALATGTSSNPLQNAPYPGDWCIVLGIPLGSGWIVGFFFGGGGVTSSPAMFWMKGLSPLQFLNKRLGDSFLQEGSVSAAQSEMPKSFEIYSPL